MKTCTKCGVEKSLDDFYNSRCSSTGKVSQCKECARKRARQWNADNSERKRAQSRKWHHANKEKANATSAQWRKENPERAKEVKHEWYENNKDHHAAKAREWYDTNLEKRKEYRKEWYQKNKQKTVDAAKEWSESNYESAQTSKWLTSYMTRCREYGITPKVLLDDYRVTPFNLTSMWGDSCYHCGGEFECIDHYPVSVVAGGEHSILNTRPSCRTCNAYLYTHGFGKRKLNDS